MAAASAIAEGEGNAAAVVAGNDAAPVLELVEQALDLVA
jgi:hypothetical protein